MISLDRYAFAPVSSAGLLLDLQSGALFRLNESAALVWRMYLSGTEQSEIIRAVELRYGIDQARARADVVAALDPGGYPDHTPPNEDFLYERTARGYVQLYKGRPVFEVNTAGTNVSLAASPDERRPRHLMNSLRALTPKVLSLRGFAVLHASAVLAAGRLLVFAGPSGAGKTSTARALVTGGAMAISEDKLLVELSGDTVMAWSTAESSIDAWVTRALITVLADGQVSCDELMNVCTGQKVALNEIGFIDANRRKYNDVTSHRLDPAEAGAELFQVTFLGSGDVDRWRRQLECAALIAERIPSYALTMPDGLTALATAGATLARIGTVDQAAQIGITAS
jgi:hypothetical protein